MKKLIISALAMIVAVTVFAEYRVVDGTPNASGVLNIGITDYSRLSSIICDVTASGETNSFTITVQTIYPVGTTNVMTYATAIADQIAGAEVATIYNTDMDTTTLHTQWLKPGDVLKLTGNDGTQTAYSNVYYRVVLEKPGK